MSTGTQGGLDHFDKLISTKLFERKEKKKDKSFIVYQILVARRRAYQVKNIQATDGRDFIGFPVKTKE